MAKRLFEVQDDAYTVLETVVTGDQAEACACADRLVEEGRTIHAYVIEFPCDEEGEYDQCANLGRKPSGALVVARDIYESADWIGGGGV